MTNIKCSEKCLHQNEGNCCYDFIDGEYSKENLKQKKCAYYKETAHLDDSSSHSVQDTESPKPIY